MEDQGDIRRDFYPHSSIAKTAAENIELAQGKLADEKAKLNQSVAALEYKNLSDESFKNYNEVISEAKQGIKDLYSRAGVEIRDEDFAEIHLLRSQVQEGQKKEAGSYISNIHSLYISAESGAGFFENAVSIYHELLHSVGRHAEVVLAGGESFAGQTGYATIVKEGVLKRTTGEFLEEGMATYYANKFALESNSEVMQEARRRYVMHVETKAKLSNEERKAILGMSQQEKENYICQVKLRERQMPQYTDAERMIGILIQGAARSDPDQYAGHLMEADLLRSRVLSKNRIPLMERIDGVFGQGTTQELFHLRFDSPARIGNAVRRLENQVYG